MSAALLIGVGQYDQATFQPLSAPAQDVSELQELLRNPYIGASRESEVIVLNEPTLLQVRSAIAALCSNRKPDELVLVYFSGYGIVNDRGQLFLPCRDTDAERLDQTAYSTNELQACLEACRSQQQVIILDCCFSGSFAKGMVSPADVDAIGQQLSSKRRALLTSPWSIDYSPKHKSGNPSTYTQYLLNALETGMADGDVHRSLDGKTTVLDLYHYIRTRLEEDLPAMYPKLYSIGQSGDIVIAQAPYLEFRREALGLALFGEISIVGHNILEELRLKYGIPTEIANSIKQDVLLPYQHQAQKRRRFEDIEAEVSRREMPLSDNTKVELMRLREIYELEDNPFARSPLPVTEAPIDTPASPANAVVVDPASDEPASEAPAPENRVTRFLRDRGLIPTPLRTAPRDPSEADVSSPDQPNRSAPPDAWRLALVTLAVLSLLGAVLWVAFMPIFPRSNPQFATANAWFNEALQRSQRRDRSGAIDAYTQALNLNPNNPVFYYNRGIEHARAGDLNRAIADYNLAIQYNPAFADAYFNRANALASRGDRTGALRDYREAERLYRQQGLTELERDAQNAIRNLERQQ